MKSLLVLAALAVASAACQPQADTTTVLSAPVAARQPSGPAKEPKLPALFAPTDTLSAAMRSLLRQYDLSGLWSSTDKQRRNTPVLEGFFGPDHYRFMMVITAAQRDAQDPAIYRVQGKCHYRKNIRPFSGTLAIR